MIISVFLKFLARGLFLRRLSPLVSRRSNTEYGIWDLTQKSFKGKIQAFGQNWDFFGTSFEPFWDFQSLFSRKCKKGNTRVVKKFPISKYIEQSEDMRGTESIKDMHIIHLQLQLQHYRLRGSIGFFNVQKKSKSKRLFHT